MQMSDQRFHTHYQTRRTQEEKGISVSLYTYSVVLLHLRWKHLVSHLTPRKSLYNVNLSTKDKKHRIQDEIYRLELEGINLDLCSEGLGKIAAELGMVEPTEASQIIWGRVIFDFFP